MAFADLTERIRPILGAVRSLTVEPARAEQPRPTAPFVTISRQAGAGAWSLAQRLADSLNALDPAPQPWTCWDRELVEKVAQDHHIHKTLVESLEETGHSWLEEIFASLSISGEHYPAEERVYRCVIKTIRALAGVGRVIIVGSGGVYITRDLPGGVHVRLEAPLHVRVEHMMRLMHFSREAAETYVRQTDRRRDAFYRRYWPKELMTPEVFTIILNSAALSEEQMIGAVVPLLRLPATSGPAAAEQSEAPQHWPLEVGEG